MERMYTPRDNDPMRVVVMFSGSASSLQYLLERDPNLGKKYRIVGAFADRKSASGIELVQSHNIPIKVLDYREFIAARGVKFNDLGERDEFFQEAIDLIDPWKPDILIHTGFMLIATKSYLEHYRNRVLNVHPADLEILDKNGRRKYTGLHVVEKALSDGVSATRSTIHLVTEGIDEGPIIVRSEPLQVGPNASADEHQEKMKWACDGPAYQRALGLIADGKVWISDLGDRIEIRE